MRAVYKTVSYNKIKDVYIAVTEIYNIAYHEHKDYEIIAVLKGGVFVRTKNESYTIGQNGFAVFNPKTAHEIKPTSENTILLLLQYSPYFCREYYPNARRMTFLNSNATSELDDNINNSVIRQICDVSLCYFKTDRLYEIRFMSKMFELMLTLAENLPCEYVSPISQHKQLSRENKLNAVIEYLESEYQHKINMRDIAAAAGLKPSYLSHFFYQNTGITVRDYVSNLRFEHARRTISRDLALGDIASGSGFSDLKYMTKEFIKRTGMTPSEYRLRVGEGVTPEDTQKLDTTYDVKIYSDADSVDILKNII